MLNIITALYVVIGSVIYITNIPGQILVLIIATRHVKKLGCRHNLNPFRMWGESAMAKARRAILTPSTLWFDAKREIDVVVSYHQLVRKAKEIRNL